MGMYDSLCCETDLPLDEKLKNLDIVWTSVVFQTKDLDCFLSNYRITKNGTLEQDVIEYDYVLYTEEELKLMRKRPWSLVKKTIIKNKYIETLDHHGKILFYTDVEYTDEKDLWVDFEAYFVYGKLDKITLVRVYEVDAQRVTNAKWEKKYRAEAARPWNKFRAAVGPFGWRWFWKQLSEGLRHTAEALQNISFKIIKNIL